MWFFFLLGGFFLFWPFFRIWVGFSFVGLGFFCLWFFRDPEREVPTTEDVLAPADGRVMEVSTVDGEGFGSGTVVRIFLSVFDVHVQRVPVTGVVGLVRYTPGLFLDARDKRACHLNEMNAVEILHPKGRFIVKQIAGWVARRIVCWVRESDQVKRGERLGLIRMGSQVDLYMPPQVQVQVKEGQRVVGGVTVVGRWTEAAAC